MPRPATIRPGGQHPAHSLHTYLPTPSEEKVPDVWSVFALTLPAAILADFTAARLFFRSALGTEEDPTALVGALTIPVLVPAASPRRPADAKSRPRGRQTDLLAGVVLLYVFLDERDIDRTKEVALILTVPVVVPALVAGGITRRYGYALLGSAFGTALAFAGARSGSGPVALALPAMHAALTTLFSHIAEQ